MHKILSVIFPAVFAIGFFLISFKPFIEYYEKPYPTIKGQVVDKFALLKKNKTFSEKNEFLLIQNPIGETERESYSKNNKTILTNDEIVRIENWKSKKELKIDCTFKKYDLKKINQLNKDFNELKKESVIVRDTLEVNDSVVFIYNTDYYYSKLFGFKLKNKNTTLYVGNINLEKLEALSTKKEVNLYYLKPTLASKCSKYYNFIAIGSIPALFHKTGYFWVFFFVCGLFCLLITIYNIRRGGQRINE